MTCAQWLTIVGTLVWVWSAAPDAAEVLRTTLVVRVYDTVGLAPAIEARALSAASESLGRALVDVRWKHCTPGLQGAEQSCARPLALQRDVNGAAGPIGQEEHGQHGNAVTAQTDTVHKEVSVRIVRAAMPANTSAALGDAFIDTRQGDAVLATIYYNRAGTDPSMLLGRALAHELGHLLMASNRHAPSGLMRPHWTRDEVRRDRAADWAFDAADVAVIRQRAMRF
jgi:hypothetical protein